MFICLILFTRRVLAKLDSSANTRGIGHAFYCAKYLRRLPITKCNFLLTTSNKLLGRHQRDTNIDLEQVWESHEQCCWVSNILRYFLGFNDENDENDF